MFVFFSVLQSIAKALCLGLFRSLVGLPSFFAFCIVGLEGMVFVVFAFAFALACASKFELASALALGLRIKREKLTSERS
jgi:hypothetical protein